MKYIKYVAVVLSLVLLSTACAPGAAPTPTPVGIKVPTPSGSDAGNVLATPVNEVLVPTTEPITLTTTMSATFDTGSSGSICPNRTPELEIGDPPPYIGEIGDSYGCEGFWTFNISGIPSQAKILSATFVPGACVTKGDPLSYKDSNGSMGFEFVEVGTLDVGDYGQGGAGWAFFEKCPDNVDLTSYMQTRFGTGMTMVQIRGYMLSGNYSNGVDDYVSYRTGNIPTLTIEYSNIQ